MPRRLACLILLLLWVVPAGAEVFEDAPAVKPPTPAVTATQPASGPEGDAAGVPTATSQPPPQAPADIRPQSEPAAPVTQPATGPWDNTAGGDAATSPSSLTAPVPATPQAPAKVQPPQKPCPSAVSPAAQAAEQAEIERRRQAQLDYTQALDQFNAGRYAKAAEL
ncbi:MAG: hypothetical protein KJ921_13245, partial [Proteobacteria bacterium]|nr:hypothetical protein [Pseudomonadota bacterium]